MFVRCQVQTSQKHSFIYAENIKIGTYRVKNFKHKGQMYKSLVRFIVNKMNLYINGITCASGIWRVENLLRKESSRFKGAFFWIVWMAPDNCTVVLNFIQRWLLFDLIANQSNVLILYSFLLPRETIRQITYFQQNTLRIITQQYHIY